MSRLKGEFGVYKTRFNVRICTVDRYNVVFFFNLYMYKPLLRPIEWTLAKSVDPNQTLQNAASDQGLHCLHKVQGLL